MNTIPQSKLEACRVEYEELRQKMEDPTLFGDQREYKRISKRFGELNELIRAADALIDTDTRLEENRLLQQEEKDEEMLALAKEEEEQLQTEQENRLQVLKDLLVPKDPNDEKDAIVEIRAGTGGDEAALFAAELFRMYSYYATRKGWKMQLISASPTELGGYKEIAFQLSGDGVYGQIRFESGAHRVQRVPETEAQGRIHTSAVTVAVLPEAEEVDVQINEADLRIDVYRSQGHGGQSVNTTDSAVRITHLPTGLVVTCQDEKSQLKNKNKALKVLRSRLYDMELAKKEAETAASRKAQVGTGDRSGKIRTYNFPQSRVTDHRINLTSYKLSFIMEGELDEFVEALRLAYRNEKAGA